MVTKAKTLTICTTTKHLTINKMRRHTQRIRECEHCGKTFEDMEEYWLDSYGNARHTDNKCGWEDDYYNETFNTNQENLPDSTNGYTYYPQENKTVFNNKEK